MNRGPSTDRQPTTEPVAVVERFLDEVVNGGRPESAPDLLDSMPLRRRVEAMRSAFADLHVRVVRTVADQQLVSVHLIATGTHTGPFQGAAPTGRLFSSACTAIFEVSGGRIVDFWLTWDILGIAEQLGIVRRAVGSSA